jgi:multidrug efflux pump subunit AcrB
MKTFLAGVSGAYNVEDNLLTGPREVRFVMDEARASIHGLTFQDLALTLRGANDGLIASTFKPPDSDEDIDIRVLYDDRYRQSEQDLLQAEVRTPNGYRVKLADVGNIEVSGSYLSLGHHDTKRSVIVYADVIEGVATSESLNRLLQARFADLDVRFPDVEVVYGGEFQETQRAFSDTFRILPIALLLIYVILAAEFRSYGQPFIVLLAVPFGVMGVLLGLAVFGYPLSFGAMYVIVGLSGVVVNDSLILVDFINRSRTAGMSLYEAVLLAGRTRFRPVLLTTVTTVVALLPTALGLFGRSKSFGSLAAAFATGLSLATVFTLFVVPTVYYSTALIAERRRQAATGLGSPH